MKRVIVTNGVYSILDENRTDMPRITVYALSRVGGLHAAAWHEMVECTYHGLRSLRYDVRLETRVSELSGNVIVIGGIGLTADEIGCLPPRTINYNSEHTSSRWFADPSHPYRNLLAKFPVWDYSVDNTFRIRDILGITAQYVPLGYVPELTRLRRTDTDIDILFYGSHSERRDTVINQMRGLGLSVHHAFGAYGPERDELIQRSKVIVNIHQMLPGAFEIARVAYLLANAKAVVSEHNPGETIDDDLTGALVLAPYDHLAAACHSLVQDDDRRMALENQALVIFSRRNEAVILRNAIASLGEYF